MSPSASDDSKRAQHVIAHAQSWLDTRTRLSDLAADDPLRLADPALPWLFWEGTGGNRELVHRPVVIENVTYTTGQTPPLRFTLRRIQP